MTGLQKEKYFDSSDSAEDAAMRQKLRNMMSTMQTDTTQVEAVISKFEDELDDLSDRIDSLEGRVSKLERKLDV